MKTDTTLWFIEIDGQPIAICNFTRKDAINEATGNSPHTNPTWKSMCKAGYSCSKYKVRKVK